MPIRIASPITTSFNRKLRTASPITASFGRQSRLASPVTVALLRHTPMVPRDNYPLVFVEIAFNSNPTEADPIWTDVAGYVQSFRTKRGRQMELDTFQPGTAEIVLKNQGREFDPTYSPSPFAPNVKIGKRMRIRALWGNLLDADTADCASLLNWGGSDITREVSTAHARTGTSSLLVTTTDVSWCDLESTVMPLVSPGVEYTFSAYVWLASGLTKNLFIGLYAYRLETFEGGFSYVPIAFARKYFTLVGNDDWQRVWITTTTPPGTTHVLLIIGVNGAQGVFDFYVDSAQLWYGPPIPYSLPVEGHLFDGYIEAWPQTWEQVTAARVPVRASDAFKRFELFPLNGDYPGSVNADGPWGYWQFSGNLSDSGGHGNNGTWNGSNPTAWGGFTPLVSGYSSKSFDASTDYMTHATDGWAVGGFTIEAWIYPNWNGNDGVTHGFWQSAATTGANPANTISLFKYSSNTLYFRVISAGGLVQDKTLAVNASNFPASGWRHVVCTASPTEGLRLYLDGVEQGAATYVGTLSLPSIAPTAPRWGMGLDAYANSYLAQCALFSVALRPDQVADRWKSKRCYFAAQDAPTRLGAVLDVVGWPAGDRDIDGGVATLGFSHPNESALSYVQRVNNSEVGRLFMGGNGKVRFIGRDAGFTPPYTNPQVTFGDDASGGEIPYSDITLSFDDIRVWNEIRMQREGGTVQVARDTTLQASDIVRRYQDTSLLHSTDAQTLAAAQYRLSQYKDAVLRVDGLTIKPIKDPVMWPEVLGREIGDRGTVVRRPQHIGTLSQQVYIEGIEHAVDAKGEWETTYTLSLADVTTFWILGDAARSVLGSTTVLSF